MWQKISTSRTAYGLLSIAIGAVLIAIAISDISNYSLGVKLTEFLKICLGFVSGMLVVNGILIVTQK